MKYPLQWQFTRRAPRLRLAENTPAVLRSSDGRQVPGKLQVVSVTGGLLSLPKTLLPGAQVKLLFIVGSGSIFGGAEMLNPVSITQQPFRFNSLYHDDRVRLQSAIRSSIGQNPSDSRRVWPR